MFSLQIFSARGQATIKIDKNNISLKKQHELQTKEQIIKIIDYEQNKDQFQTKNDFIAYEFCNIIDFTQQTIKQTEDLCKSCNKMTLGKQIVPWRLDEDEQLNLSARDYAVELDKQLNDILDDEDILPSNNEFQSNFPKVLYKPLIRMARFLAHIAIEHENTYQDIESVVDNIRIIYYFIKKYNICDSKQIEWMKYYSDLQ